MPALIVSRDEFVRGQRSDGAWGAGARQWWRRAATTDHETQTQAQYRHRRRPLDMTLVRRAPQARTLIVAIMPASSWSRMWQW